MSCGFLLNATVGSSTVIVVGASSAAILGVVVLDFKSDVSAAVASSAIESAMTVSSGCLLRLQQRICDLS